MQKLIAILLIALGEALFIIAEINVAHVLKLKGDNIRTVFALMFMLTIISAVMLLLGYYFGYKAFGNIWTIGAISISTILIVEPVFSYLIFRELPSVGIGIGFALGSLGLLVTLFSR